MTPGRLRTNANRYRRYRRRFTGRPIDSSAIAAASHEGVRKAWYRRGFTGRRNDYTRIAACCTGRRTDSSIIAAPSPEGIAIAASWVGSSIVEASSPLHRITIKLSTSATGRSPTFAIVLDDKVIGTVNLEIDARRKIAMLGFAIGRSYWGAGMGTEAACVAVAWAFEEFRLAKIWATTDARHARSRRLLEKLGMKCEGLLRGEELARDGRTDKAYYGLLREEWDGGRGRR